MRTTGLASDVPHPGIHLYSGRRGGSCRCGGCLIGSSFVALHACSLTLTGVTATVVFGATHNDVHENLPAIDGAGLGPAMSAIAFLFLSHIVTLPMAQSLHDDLKRPRAFHKVVWTSYVFITFANLAFGKNKVERRPF